MRVELSNFKQNVTQFLSNGKLCILHFLVKWLYHAENVCRETLMQRRVEKLLLLYKNFKSALTLLINSSVINSPVILQLKKCEKYLIQEVNSSKPNSRDISQPLILQLSLKQNDFMFILNEFYMQILGENIKLKNFTLDVTPNCIAYEYDD